MKKLIPIALLAAGVTSFASAQTVYEGRVVTDPYDNNYHAVTQSTRTVVTDDVPVRTTRTTVVKESPDYVVFDHRGRDTMRDRDNFGYYGYQKDRHYAPDYRVNEREYHR